MTLEEEEFRQINVPNASKIVTSIQQERDLDIRGRLPRTLYLVALRCEHMGCGTSGHMWAVRESGDFEQTDSGADEKQPRWAASTDADEHE